MRDETASVARFIDYEARRETFKAYLQRNRGRLFPIPDIEAGRDRRMWRKLDDVFWGKAVGVVPPDDSSEDRIIVGIWAGIGPGFLGYGLRLEHFEHPGCTTHRSPYSIGYVHVLSRKFQMVAEAQWREDDDAEEWNANAA